jgi:hypothetical protein
MNMKCGLKRLICRFLLLVCASVYCVTAMSAAAQNYFLRYANTISGAITFSGNTLR